MTVNAMSFDPDDEEVRGTTEVQYTKQKQNSILMAITINSHTFTVMIFNWPAMVLALFVLLPSRAANFLCSARVSFGDTKMTVMSSYYAHSVTQWRIELHRVAQLHIASHSFAIRRTDE